MKVKNGPCSEEEWEQFLAAILLGRESIPNIEAAAHVAEEDSITITIRRRVGGITVSGPGRRQGSYLPLVDLTVFPSNDLAHFL